MTIQADAIHLKVDVDTWRGTREGVPHLLSLFDRHQVRATFLFSLGPDHTGRALRRVFRPGFLQKVGRTSVLSHYGLLTLMYGVLLPGPHIANRESQLLRSVAAAGHEVGVHCHDHVRWQDGVAKEGPEWTRQELALAVDAFQQVFAVAPTVHGAAGWQVNRHVPELETSLGFRYASDCRGREPFLPIIEGSGSPCPQLPTTLPTLDELLGLDGWREDNLHEPVLRHAQTPAPKGHVFTLHAELEGMKLLPVMDRLLHNWHAEGRSIDALDALYSSLDLATLPQHSLVWGEVPGRSGQLALQGSQAGTFS